ncbi:MAG: hypothetical protein LRY51_02385 [Geovibrio sp.]|nr:hypothetical protein [Geovibrio sp.]
MDSLNESGLIIQREAPGSCYNTGRYKKGEMRFPFYFSRLKASGDTLRKYFTAHRDKIYLPDWDMEDHLSYYEPTITWRPNKVNSVKKGDRYDLVSITYKTQYSPMRIGAVDQLPYLNETGEAFDPFYGTVSLNAETAKDKGLATGDTVVVESEYGKVSGKLYVTELLQPGVVGIAGSLGRLIKSAGTAEISTCITTGLPGTRSPILIRLQWGVTNTVPVRIYKQS